MDADNREYEWVTLGDGRQRYQPVDGIHREKVSDPWANHWSLSMGAATDAQAAEIGKKCADAGVDCKFNKHLMLQVTSRRHQQQLREIILGPGSCNADESMSR